MRSPRCSHCKKFYSIKDEDASGLCPKCRPANVHPVMLITLQAPKRKAKGDTNMEKVNQDQKEGETIHNTDSHESLPCSSHESKDEHSSSALSIVNLISPGKKGVTNFQMIPAIQRAIEANSIEALTLLKVHYPDVFAGSLRYLKKKQRDYVEANVK